MGRAAWAVKIAMNNRIAGVALISMMSLPPGFKGGL